MIRKNKQDIPNEMKVGNLYSQKDDYNFDVLDYIIIYTDIDFCDYMKKNNIEFYN